MRVLLLSFVLMFSTQTFAQTRKATPPKKAPPTKEVAKKTAPPAAARVTPPVKSTAAPARKTTPPPHVVPHTTPIDDELAQGEKALQMPYQPPRVHSINSILYFTPANKFTVEGDLSVAFGTYTLEKPALLTPTSITTDERDTFSIRNEYALRYGFLPQLAVELVFGYLSSTEKNTSVKDNIGTFGIPLEPEVTDKGFTDPEINAYFRLLDGDFVVDLSGGVRLAFMNAESGEAYDTTGDTPYLRGDKASEGNSASGAYAVSGAVRTGLKITDRLLAAGSLGVQQNFSGQRTLKQSTDLTADTEAFTVFTPEIEAQFFLTPAFALNPFFRVIFNPQQDYKYMTSGQSVSANVDPSNTYIIGARGSYAIAESIEVHGSYAWTTIDSSKLKRSTNGGPSTDISNAKNRDTHTLSLGARFEF